MTSANAMSSYQGSSLTLGQRVDWPLLCLWFVLLSVGLVMVSSASISFSGASKFTHYDAWYFAKRHSIYLVMGLMLAIFVVAIPISIWEKYAAHFLIFTLFLLLIVLIPGIGHRVNGSRRWLNLGFIMVQASEIAKVCAIIFFASFFSRRYHELHFGWQGFLKPLLLLGVFVFLLLLEPDFGSSVVLTVTVISMMFIAGVRIWHFMLLIIIAVTGMASVAIFSPYRMQRLVTYLDPWADPLNGGYQLTQSLIGFGRGEWTGLGLGNSLQKLFFLPEAHTDFIFAIIAEEFGLLGAVVMVGLFAALVVRIIMVAKNNLARGKVFAALATFGVAILFSFQVFVNIGVSSGLLPTKGLTLPFISYGGSSLLICCALMAFVLRAQWEVAGLNGAEAVASPKAESSKRKAVML
ncbi:putative lipid II flippase FtsW [Cellvibrio zantedeschiae]|uniref:Probable peptidoglycan glycosyltransferase FtsW n=1 Tax=Cellvibrio zantedeschiae TaxID=1237077 RepID=A0ABQ3AQA9_9GAMM|nr:putative lipid II flippase FtsW [Cellvibrio zantedeschiae]GGY62764.1 putative lipid II flippase FtsW [Cellvibrio zantedeschiae]